MKLTRTVLLEKHITFKYYTSPDKVPDFLWKEAIEVLGQSGVSPTELFTVYAEFVLIPLLKLEYWRIHGPIYEQRTFLPLFYLDNYDISISVCVDFESLIDARMKGSESLKDLTIKVWDEKMNLMV